ncbi:MAG: ATP-binding protein [Treponema sp.]|nr:ATP-binding protein [Treponema sp.]
MGLPALKQKSKIAARARGISMGLLVLLLVLITGTVAVTIRSISDNAAVNLVRAFSIEVAEKFSHYISQDLSLVRRTALSKAITGWFADEDNEAKKMAAFIEMSDYAHLFHGVHLYLGIHKTLNEYSIKDKIAVGDFDPFDRLNPLNPADSWYFECVNSGNDYSLKMDVEKRAGIWHLWINHKVTSDGNLVGVFASGLEMPDMFHETFEGFGEKEVKGYLINKHGIIQSASTSLQVYLDEYNEINNWNIRRENIDSVFTAALDSYESGISGLFGSHSQPEIIRLPKGGTYKYAAIKPIPNTDWSVIVFHKNNSLFGVKGLLPLFIVLLAALILYVTVMDIMLRRNFFTPIHRLTQNISESNAAGVEHIGKNRDDEIGELAQTIQEMWERLSTFNLELLNATLERKRQQQLLHAVNNTAAVLLESADREDFLASVQDGMSIIGYSLDVDRVQIWQNEMLDGELYFVLKHEWLSETGKQAVVNPHTLQFPYSVMPKWKEQFLKGEYLNGPLSGLSSEDQQFLEAHGIKSIVVIPLFVQNQFWGLFSIDDCRNERTFTEGEIDILRSGSLMMVSALLRNVQTVQLHEAHERVTLQSHWYKSILDATPFPVSVTDANMCWTFANKSVEDFLGTKLEDMLGKPCSNWNANICNTPDCGIACAKRGLKRTYFTYSGASYQVDVETLKDMNGEDAGFIEVVQDITKIKEMEKEALSASKAKSDFLATMSHEMRTPMNAILGIAEIQLQDDTLPPKTREALDKIYNSGDLLLNIINDILDLSKIEAGKLELTPAEYKIASLISDTVTLNMMRIGSRSIEFKLSVDENMPSILYGDELRIKQILNNLLSNAIKYTKEGMVKLSASLEPSTETAVSVKTGAVTESGGKENNVMLVFKVSDTGQGMTSEQVNNLFDEYSRFNMEANRTTEGTGLGMSITRNLVQMMNGKISVESEVHKGTVFTVRIPQKDTDSGVLGRELAESLEKFQVNGVKQMKRAQVVFEPMPYGSVLVVDDVESNLYVAKGLMAPYGLTIETVMSGIDAINRIKSGSVYDLIFMDHMMPEMDGIDAAKNIRDLGYTHPIVALTANAVVGQSDIFLANGFDSFISKPIDVRQLDSTLKKYIKNKQPPEVTGTVPEQRAERRSEETQPAAAPLHSWSSAPDKLIARLAKFFIRDAQKAITTLESIHEKRPSYGDDGIKLYMISVHGMKSALANIGEPDLSAVAFKLEQAAKEKNTAVMENDTPEFLSGLRKIIEKLSLQDSENKKDEAMNETSDDVRTYLRGKLFVIIDACKIYDRKSAKDTITELRQKAWSPLTQELLDAMAMHLLNGDFIEMSQDAEKIIKNT